MTSNFRIGLSGCGGGLEAVATRELLDLAEWAESLGVDALWLNEQHFQGGANGGRKCHSPLILAAAILARTQRLRVGFSVLLMDLHQPVRLAEDLASLDVLSEGRVNIGIARGANPDHRRIFGITHDDRSHARFEEALNLMRRAWGPEPLTIDGVTVPIEPKPFQQPHPPIYIGTFTAETATWAANAGHRMIVHGINSLHVVRPLMSAFTAAGGDPKQVPFGRFVFVDETDEDARKNGWDAVSNLSGHMRRSGAGANRQIIAFEEELNPESYYNNLVIAGSPETVTRRILALREEFGFTYLNALSALFGFLPKEAMRRSIQLLMTEVLPAVRSERSHGSAPGGFPCGPRRLHSAGGC